MKQKSSSETNYKTIRTRLTGVVVVPSVVLLLMWALFSSYTVFDGFYQRAVAQGVKDASIPAVQTFAAIQRERELTMTSLSQPGSSADLRAQQARTDEGLGVMRSAFATLSGSAPQQVVDGINNMNGLLSQLPNRRAQVEAGKTPKREIYDYYNSLLDAAHTLFTTQARIVPDPVAVQGGLASTQYFQAADWMSRATSIASGSLAANEFTDDDRVEFANLVGAYRSSLSDIQPYAEPRVREHHRRITESEDWKKVENYQAGLIRSDGERPTSVVSLQDWQAATSALGTELTKLVTEQSVDATDVTLVNGENKFNTVLIGSLIALLAVVIGIFVAVRISNRLVNRALISRLVKLKNDSLDLAHERLPDIVERLRKGEHVDVEAEVPSLDYGQDEIGQVADAFNAAQFTAVAAAVKESQVRDGVNRVFLDIAHRNQGLVHRQLKILDKLEREEESPEQLDALFQLDHLATRARRNAENLIILAGEQPGRQWRKPVRMIDILRAGVAETEQYVRVKMNPVPDTALVGGAVADTIHLIAELVDNATAFSSPRSQVQVHSSQVPQGIVVEIEDHGLGMSPEDRARANEMLANPPEFDAMSLRGESRLGLFVVARLADRRKIRVELRESLYGGTLALVLIPSEIVAGPSSNVEPANANEITARRGAPEHDLVHSEAARQGDLSGEARFPGAPGESSSGVEDFWAKAETEIAGDSHAAQRSPVIAQVELPRRSREAQWPVDDPEAPETVQMKMDLPRSRPELPRRRRQQNLAPQLATDDHLIAPEPIAEAEIERSAERTRQGLAAFQKGAREARRGDNDLEP
ncbi:sensor histidine kinase [Umezawaea tangerina]|uniref:sensor histidine kinase n=1 Tax=Umezawaea tangerina TaxID=84725 RepID=UPI000AD817C9|nr:nitrate- and nitrite sensing domain-containing protein [Umezawaea tangerina]